MAALKGLIDLAEAEQPDLIVHSGDLFDASRPPYPALQTGVRALARLSRVAPTVVVAGNHDSGQLFKVLHQMAGLPDQRRLWFVASPDVLEIPQLGDGFALAAVPFIPPSLITDLAVADVARLEGTYADGVRQLNTHLLARAREIAGSRGITVYSAHLHVAGARPSRSERTITIGEDYATAVDSLAGAMYSAFGHIHDPQLLPGGMVTGRYAGSLIPIDFGERTQHKQAVLVELGDDVRVEERPLPTGRPLLQFDGTLDELEAKAAAGHLDGVILKGRIASQDPILDLSDKLAAWAPDCAVFDLVNAVANRPVKPITSTGTRGEEPPVEALFAEWRATARRTARRAPDDEVIEAFRTALSAPGDGVDLGTSALVTGAERALDALRGEARGWTCDR